MPAARETYRSWSWRCSSRFGSAFDGTHNSNMRGAAAKVVSKRLLDLSLGGLWVFLQEGCRLHDHAVGAVAALHGLLFDKGRLQLVGVVGCAQPFERQDLIAVFQRDR